MCEALSRHERIFASLAHIGAYANQRARLGHTVTALRFEYIVLEIPANVRASYQYSKAHVFKQAQHETCGLPNTIAHC
jgi:hypothetical protein